MYEWAQLLRGPAPPDQLESGHWYRVVDRMRGGFIRVMGPNAVGIPTNDSVVRIVDQKPNTVTRVQKTVFGIDRDDVDRELSYYGICPKGHRIEPLRRGDSIIQCDQCGVPYDIEDEEVWLQSDVEGQGNETTADDLGTT